MKLYIEKEDCCGCGACADVCQSGAIRMVSDREGFLYPYIKKKMCVSCGKCKKVCPMNVDITDNSRKRKNGTECILCFECVKACPKKAL